MSTKHTPGPWQIDSEAGQVHIVTTGSAIARVMAMRADGCGEANSRLIAAAPELLAALKTAAEVIGHPDDSFSMYMARLIAKATGESA
jgi:hypothetical protein